MDRAGAGADAAALPLPGLRREGVVVAVVDVLALAEEELTHARFSRQAEADAVLERKKAEDEMKHEIANVSAQLTGKLLQREINEEDHRSLIDSFLNDLD